MFITPQWNAPTSVRAATTIRYGGVSKGPYADFNLASHVGDDPQCVAANRKRLAAALDLPAEPLWLDQQHGIDIIDSGSHTHSCSADGIYSDRPAEVCVILSADCLPVLLCSADGYELAAVHAGWRGLCGGILRQAVARFRCSPARLLAWLGPAISSDHYEIGEELRDQFVASDPALASAFSRRSGQLRMSLQDVARTQLVATGVTSANVTNAALCTFRDRSQFFSYRRDGITGRNATLIWRAA